MKKVTVYSERLDIYGSGEIIAVNPSDRFLYTVRINDRFEVRLRADELLEVL